MFRLLTDDSGTVVLKDGLPVYVKDDGSQFVPNINDMYTKITEAKSNEKTLKDKIQGFETKIKAFDGVDPEKARDALDKISKIDQSKLIESGQVEQLKKEINSQWQVKHDEAQSQAGKATETLNNYVVSNAFNRSKYIQDNVNIPVDMLQSAFAQNFKVEDGKVRAYRNGNLITSSDVNKIGDPADFEEAIKSLVDGYEHRDRILKTTVASGSGINPSGGGAGGNKISKADFGKLDPMKQREQALLISQGKMSLSD